MKSKKNIILNIRMLSIMFIILNIILVGKVNAVSKELDVNEAIQLKTKASMYILAKENSIIRKEHEDWLELTATEIAAIDKNGNKEIDTIDILILKQHILAMKNSKVKEQHPEWIIYVKNNDNPAPVKPTPSVSVKPTPTTPANTATVKPMPTAPAKPATVNPTPAKPLQTKPIVVDVTNVKLNKSTLTIQIGKVDNLKVTVLPSNASNKSVTWSSSNTKIVTVGKDGTIKGIKSGSAKITAKTKNGKTAMCTVKVKNIPIKEVKVTKIPDLYTTGLTAITPNVKLSYSGKKLVKGKDYTVSYKNNVDPGKATITIKGKGDYTGTRKVNFRLVNIGDDVARFACSISYTKGIFGVKGTAKYRATGAWNACHSGMWAAWKKSGYWTKFEYSNYDVSSAWKSDKSRWVYIGNFVPGSRVSSKGIKLLPGDTLRGHKGGSYHTCMYVGKSIPIEVYNKKLKNTDADKGKPTGDFTSAHYSGSAPMCICDAKWSYANYYGSNMEIYRCIKPDISKYRAGKTVK